MTPTPSGPGDSPHGDERAAQLLLGLSTAIAHGELSLFYQPQVSLIDGSIVGAEALLRWRHPVLGEVSPVEFIPLAERTGLITPIGDWVLREACRQIAEWRSQGLSPVRIGINVSPIQFQGGDLVQRVRDVLLGAGVEAAMLGVEVTESALLHNTHQVAAALRELRSSGVEIALDDFGTGFSSLSRLRDLPIDVVKIDRSFVSDVTVAAESASVTRSIIQLAHGLKIRVLAEGAETDAQAAMLSTHGCDLLQGYCFSAAVDAAAMAALLKEARHLPMRLTQRALRTRTLLLVDDEENILAALKRLFRRDGYRILTATSGADALLLLSANEVDVIVSDQRMPGMTGVDFLRRAKAIRPETIRMTLSGFTDLQSIIDAVNEGAVYKFLTKPWDDARLRDHVAQAFQQKQLVDDNLRLNREVAHANAELANLNQQLEQLLARQREQSQLMEDSASGARDLVDALPAAIFGLDTDGMLAYLNQGAISLMPQALECLGAEPGDVLHNLAGRLRQKHQQDQVAGEPVIFNETPHRAWLCRIPDQPSPRGELLVLIPSSESQTP